ncbi:hypothetical protein RRG08_017063, partial [Elysia crispata]
WHARVDGKSVCLSIQSTSYLQMMAYLIAAQDIGVIG